MTAQEKEFWGELRFSITRSRKIENTYCDWIEPKTYYLDIPKTIIEGRVGFIPVGEFKFILTIAKNYIDLSEIEWENLIPSEEYDDWLILNGETIEITIIEKQ